MGRGDSREPEEAAGHSSRDRDRDRDRERSGRGARDRDRKERDRDRDKDKDRWVPSACPLARVCAALHMLQCMCVALCNCMAFHRLSRTRFVLWLVIAIGCSQGYGTQSNTTCACPSSSLTA
jgi:hypothetical protein